MKYSILLFCFFICGCLPDEAQNYEIINAKLGDVTLYIPKEYVKFRHTSIGTESALLQAWYPGAAPVPGDDSTELWKQGIWWKNVMILVSMRHDTTIPFDKGTKSSIKYLRATEFAGDEYGLQHYTQAPDDHNQDLYDVWLEKDNDFIISRITCTEKISELSKPNCTHYFFWNDLSAKITFDRRFLSDWKTINQNVTSMLESFQSPESAQTFLRTQFENQNNLIREN